MEVTMTELALFIWGMFMTICWQNAKHEMRMNKLMTLELMRRIAKGKVKVVESRDSFEFKEV